MKTHAQTVIIGGGIGGCSALYHLTREGWTDVVLVERDELTSGATWHSAAQCPNLAPNQMLIAMRSYTIELYKELADDPDYPINYHHAVGGLRLIRDKNELDACLHVISMARGMGVELSIVSSDEAKQKNPLLNTDNLLGALFDPLDGDIDPAQLCQALARRARKAGAEIYRHNPVVGLTQNLDNTWIVHTKNGDIHCEHIVNACGYRVNEVGKMIGVEYPVASMEHMYFVTEPIVELELRSDRVAMVRCPVDTFYMRQEKTGLLVGVYEYDCKTFGMDGIDPDFVNALCPNDIDRCLPKLEQIFSRVPCLRDTGVQSIVNGPITYTSDAGPLIGPLPGFCNTWSINGLRVGIGEGGGYGRILAQMMVHGEAQWDTWQTDPRRIGSYATAELASVKAIEDYQREFQWRQPHEHRPAGRPAKTTALYPVFKDMGAVFTTINGWERVEYFKPAPDFVDTHGFRVPDWHDAVGREINTLTNSVGLLELSGFSRYEITGNNALSWLRSLSCSKIPRTIGKVSLNYFLNEKGNVLCEATLARIDKNTIWFGSAAAAEQHDFEWLSQHLPPDSTIEVKSLSSAYTALVVAGPQTRKLLTKVSPATDWSDTGFPPLSVQRCDVGHAAVVAMSISFSGEPAWELHIPNSQIYAVHDMLVTAGNEYGIGHFGMLAVDSMRLEKGYSHWKTELITEFNPIEAGLERFVDFDKLFLGKEALQHQLANGLKKKLTLLHIHDDTVRAQSQDAVMSNGTVVGSVTSAAWGFRSRCNLAMAYIDPAYAKNDSQMELLILGEEVEACVCSPPI